MQHNEIIEQRKGFSEQKIDQHPSHLLLADLKDAAVRVEFLQRILQKDDHLLIACICRNCKVQCGC